MKVSEQTLRNIMGSRWCCEGESDVIVHEVGMYGDPEIEVTYAQIDERGISPHTKRSFLADFLDRYTPAPPSAHPAPAMW